MERKITMGSLFGGGQTSQSQSGYYNLPSDMQSSASNLGSLLSSQYTDLGQYATNQGISNLSYLANPSNYANLTAYLDQVMGSSNLSQNPYYTSAMGAYTNQFETALQDALAGAGGQANAAGQFYSSNAGNYNNSLTSSLMQDYLNQTASTALSAYQSAQSYGLQGAGLYENLASTLGGLQSSLISGSQSTSQELTNLLGEMAGSSSAGYGSSLASQLSGTGSNAYLLYLLSQGGSAATAGTAATAIGTTGELTDADILELMASSIGG